MEKIIIEKLKCSECKNYLRYLPIMTNKTGESICGKCYENFKQKYTIKNKICEEIVKTLNFPCFNEKNGCKINLLISDLKNHEKNCEYSSKNCPFTGICNWSGPSDKILTHCVKKHRESVVNHPYADKLDVVIDVDKTLIISLYDNIFILKFAHNISYDKLLHSICLYGNPKLSKLFKYSFELTSKDGVMKKNFEVKKQNDTSPLNEIKISSLVNILGDLDAIDLKFCLSMIDYKCEICKNDLNFTVFVKNSKICCKNCNSLEQKVDKQQDLLSFNLKCSNDGCNFECLSENVLLKHERWFCNFTTMKCKWGCGKKLTTNRLNHYITNYTTGNDNTFTQKNNDIDVSYMNVAYIYNVKFLFKWSLENNSFSIFVVSDLQADQLGNFVCSVVLTDAATGRRVEKYLNNNVWRDKTSNYDYTLSFNAFDDIVNKYNFTFVANDVAKLPVLPIFDSTSKMKEENFL